MTVAELIEKLRLLPQDLQVLHFHDEYNRCSHLPEPSVLTVCTADAETFADMPFTLAADQTWRTGDEVDGKPFDALLLGWYDT